MLEAQPVCRKLLREGLRFFAEEMALSPLLPPRPALTLGASRTFHSRLSWIAGQELMPVPAL